MFYKKGHTNLHGAGDDHKFKFKFKKKNGFLVLWGTKGGKAKQNTIWFSGFICKTKNGIF